MSFDFSGIAVRAEMPRVHGELVRLLLLRDVSLVPPSPEARRPHVSLGEAAGWTMIALEGRLLASIGVDLSRELRTDAVCFDVDEGHGYQHVSHIVLGAPALVHTRNELRFERFPADVRPLLRAAYQRTRRQFPAALRARLDRGSWSEEDDDQLFDFFFESIAPIDALTFALDTTENPREAFDFEGPVHALAMSARPSRSWAEATGLSVVSGG